jgi:O-antigen ligase
VSPHHVIDPTHVRAPLDALGMTVYALVLLAAARATWMRAAYGVAALIAAVPFDFHRDVGHTTITISKVVLVAVFVALALRRVSFRPLGEPAARLILVAGTGVVIATAATFADALFRGPVLRETLKALEYVALFAVVVAATRADPDERPLRIALAATVGLVSLLAIAQEIVGAPSGVWFAGFAIPRIAGPLEGPNQLAAYLGLALAALVAFFLVRERARLELWAIGVAVAALILTISRAGIWAAFVGIAIVVAVSPPRQRRELAIVAASSAAVGLVVLAFWGFVATHNFGGVSFVRHLMALAEAPHPGTVGNRSQLWHAALVLWRRHPLLGIGAGNYELELAGAGFPHLRTHANSLYLQALAEGGLVLLAATLALVAASIVAFVRGPFRDPLIVGALGASVGFAVHQIFDLLVFYPKVGELWWILLALGASRVDAARSTRA